MSHLLYLALLAGCLIGTAAVELRLGTRVYARWPRLLLALLPTVVVFVTWDVYAIAQGMWSYDSTYVVGARLPGRLPLEELLFFAVIPTCAVLTYEAVLTRRPEWRP
jgi:lycopene cyclase domain-containing protein